MCQSRLLRLRSANTSVYVYMAVAAVTAQPRPAVGGRERERERLTGGRGGRQCSIMKLFFVVVLHKFLFKLECVINKVFILQEMNCLCVFMIICDRFFKTFF